MNDKWKLNKSYEYFNFADNEIGKAKLINIADGSYCFLFQDYFCANNNFYLWMIGTDDVLTFKTYIIFKDGVPEIIKNNIKDKKLIKFQKGKIYTSNIIGKKVKFLKRAKTSLCCYGIFEYSDFSLYNVQLYTINGIECTIFDGQIDLCASNINGDINIENAKAICGYKNKGDLKWNLC